jgi:hypothetical protein
MSKNKKLLRLERIYAENGLVYSVDEKGVTVKHEIIDAALKARSLNCMPIPANMKDLKKRRDHLVDQILQAIQEAQKQRESPKDKAENYITKLLNNKDEKGNIIVPTEDMNIQAYLLKYFTLTESEIAAVLRHIDRPDMREVILGEKHQERVTSPEYQEKLVDMHRK